MSKSKKASSTPRRTAKWQLKRLAIGFAVPVITVLLIRSVLHWRTARAISRELAAIKAAGEPLNWEELARSDRTGRVQPDAPGSAPSEISQLYRRAIEGAEAWRHGKGHQAYKALRDGEATDEHREALRVALQGCQEALVFFRQAAEFRGIAAISDPGLETTQRRLDQLNRMPNAGRLISAAALHAAAKGQSDEAAEWCIVFARFVRASPGHNMMTGLVRFLLTSLLCRTVDHSQQLAPASQEKLSRLIVALSDLQDETPLTRMMCGERAHGSWIFTEQFDTLGPRLFMRMNYACYLELLREVIAASRKPFPASVGQMREVEAEYTKRSWIYALEKQLLPAVSRAFDEGAMDQARVRVVLVSLAIRRIRMDTNALPADLDALVPKYLKQVPLDPFTGGPLLYRRDGSGCVVYSVGHDRADNGGKGSLKRAHDSTGTDIAVRISP